MTAEIATIQLSADEAKLVKAYVDLGTGDWLQAATISGFDKRDAKRVAKLASQSPAILAGVHVEIGRRLVEGAAVGYRVLMAVANSDDDTAQGRKLRLDAAKELLKLGGHVGPRAKAADSGGQKQLHEMSVEDLRKQRDALETAIADRSRPVSAPAMQGDDAQDIDMLE